jgi:branched-chain amino acid transport system ATP-binding protein
MLKIVDIHTYYGESYVLQGISLEVGEGSVVGILGRNGMGKTTLIRSIVGFTPPRQGQILFRDVDITHMPSYKIVRMHMGLVPQGRRIFPSLSVLENLRVGAREQNKDADSWNEEQIYEIFPVLHARRNHKGKRIPNFSSWTSRWRVWHLC